MGSQLILNIRMMSLSLKNKKSLTLIELMILVSILALISSVVFTKTSVFISHFQQKQELSKLLSYLNHLEKVATLKKIPLCLEFERKNGVFCVKETILQKNKSFKRLVISDLSGKIEIFPPNDVFLEKPIKFHLNERIYELKHDSKGFFYLN